MSGSGGGDEGGFHRKHAQHISAVAGLPLSSPNSYFFPPTTGYPYSAGWELKELACREGRLYLLEDAAHLGYGMQSWLHEWMAPANPLQFTCWTFLPTILHSMDVEVLGDRPVTSGLTNTPVLELRDAVTKAAIPHHLCNLSDLADVIKDNVAVNTIPVSHDTYNNTFPCYVHTASPKTIDVTILCK